MDRQMDKKRTNEQMELHQFRKNLAVMVIYLAVKFEFDWTHRFELESGNGYFDRTDKKQTNKRTELHQFRKRSSCGGDLCPCQV